MKNPLKVLFLSISAAAVVGLGLSSGLPWLATIDNTPQPISHKDEGVLVDHIFEFENAVITGLSANSGTSFGHLCTNKSLYAYPGFSNGLVLRNISKRDPSQTVEANNPTLTFKFTSDKEYNVPIDISVASKYSSGSGWTSSTLGACFDSITNNGNSLRYGSIPIPAEKSMTSAGNYFNMQLVTIPSCRIYEGENTLVFTTGVGYLNCDFFNIRTSANIEIIETNQLITNVEQDISVISDPTSTSSGSLSIACHYEGCTNQDTFPLPTLKEGNGYKIEPIDDEQSRFSFSIYERVFSFISSTPKGRQVGDEHNELKANRASSTLFSGVDAFVGSSWKIDDGNDSSWSKNDVIDKDGNVVFENTEELNTSARIFMLYAVNKVKTANAYFHFLDRADSMASDGADVTLYGKMGTYNMTIKPSGPFSLTVGGTKNSKNDLSNENDISVFKFKQNGVIEFRQQTVPGGINWRTPTDPANGTAEIVANNANFTFNQDLVISLSVSRISSDYLVYRLSIGNSVDNLTKITFTSSIPSTDVRYDNTYAKEGNIVLHNRHITTGGGQRVGFAPELNQYVILKELTSAFSTDTWDASH